MPTRHVLYPMATRGDSAVDTDASAVVAIGGRTAWTARTHIGAAEDGSVTILVQTSATGEDDDYVTRATIGPLTAAGVYTTTFSPLPADVYLRATISALSGTVPFRLEADGGFFDLESDGEDYLSKALREFEDGGARIVREAEEDIVELVRVATRSPFAEAPNLADRERYVPEIVASLTSADSERNAGLPTAIVYDVDWSLDGANEAMKREIARQAEHIFRRVQLEADNSPSAQVSLRQHGRYYRDAGARLAKYRPQSSAVWRGR